MTPNGVGRTRILFVFVLYGERKGNAGGYPVKRRCAPTKTLWSRHAAYAAVAALRVFGVPARSEFPSPSLVSLEYVA